MAKHFITLPNFDNVRVSFEDKPPFSIEAIVYEQDTSLILANPTVIDYPFETSEQLIQQASVPAELVPGQILVETGPPLSLLAIVHDLDQTPSWQADWIKTALNNIISLVEHYHIQALAMPLLGSVHGDLAPQQALNWLHEAVTQKSLLYLKHLWFIDEQ